MAKIKTNITQLLNKKMEKEIGKNSSLPVANPITEKELVNIIDFKVIEDLTEDEKLKEFLKQETLNLFNCVAKNTITLGEIFENVANEIGRKGSTNEGLYEKWLEVNGHNKTTAWRYRQRYQLYNKVNDKAKIFVMTLPYKIINKIFKQEDFEGYINVLNEENIDINSLNAILIDDIENEVKKITEKEKAIKFNIEDYAPVLSVIKESSQKLNDEKKIELQKYLDKIVEILK